MVRAAHIGKRRPNPTLQDVVKSSLTACILVISGAIVGACGQIQNLAQVEPISFGTGTISGVVTDAGTRQPVIGATLTLLPEEAGVTEAPVVSSFAPDGAYRFANIRPGAYRLRARFAGYDSVTIDVPQVTSGVTYVLPVELRRRQ
jgi:hypothetical protein